jgi:gluconokinase
MPAFILMGVSGSGKSTIGTCVAQSLGLPFIEGDDYHPPTNVAKMASGSPLDEVDRLAWIDALMKSLNACPEQHAIVACSALTHVVRTRIRARSTRPVVFLHLSAAPTVIENRLHRRGQHFMKAGMLPSQLATLQPSAEAISIDTSASLQEICTAVQAQIVARLSA